MPRHQIAAYRHSHGQHFYHRPSMIFCAPVEEVSHSELGFRSHVPLASDESLMVSNPVRRCLSVSPSPCFSVLRCWFSHTARVCQRAIDRQHAASERQPVSRWRASGWRATAWRASGWRATGWRARDWRARSWRGRGRQWAFSFLFDCLIVDLLH